ncbi:hypothetical protein TSAR_007597 [Trichomalopsis sarcophagae]|uniref:Uncharacterized protein n=1 Tax=Trichomalopsis sarcophagae TaxID=543379 RepID=A0A232EQN4_9HYME|nr:hypothetical protein TSAR_007597 [Trichomalopsis sarcophagae]
MKEDVLKNIQNEIAENYNQHFTGTEIQQKFKYLPDIFVKSDLKIQNKEHVTYMEKFMYQRLFFLKPHIIHKRGNEVSKYKTMSSIKCTESAFDTTLNEKKGYLLNIKDNEILKKDSSSVESVSEI